MALERNADGQIRVPLDKVNERLLQRNMELTRQVTILDVALEECSDENDKLRTDLETMRTHFEQSE